MTAPRELVGRATRRAFRELASEIILREIDGMWQDEGFAPSGRENSETGQRRSSFREYEDSVDWADHQHVARALRVFEVMLRPLEDQHVERFAHLLERDGWALDDRRRIVALPNHVSPPESLDTLTDSSAILDGFARIAETLPKHPRDAIGHAKELIESTAKVVLQELGQPAGERSDDLQALVTRTQRALFLHPSTATPGPDGSEAVKKILGGMSAAAIGVAELRNRGYGSGHGQTSTPVGLHARHAYLAVGAARTWCQMILDTLVDPGAPWRNPSPPSTNDLREDP